MKLARNLALPGLPIWMARSFWVQILMVLTVLANAAGFDLFAHLGAMGFGSSQEEVLANGDRVVNAWQQIAPLIFGLWAWLERRAPNYRLTLPKKATTSAVGALFLGLALIFALAPSRVQAGGSGRSVCLPEAEYRTMLALRYGEIPVWCGDSGSYRVELLQAPSGSWTLLMSSSVGTACNITGGDQSSLLKQSLGA